MRVRVFKKNILSWDVSRWTVAFWGQVPNFERCSMACTAAQVPVETRQARWRTGLPWNGWLLRVVTVATSLSTTHHWINSNSLSWDYSNSWSTMKCVEKDLQYRLWLQAIQVRRGWPRLLVAEFDRPPRSTKQRNVIRTASTCMSKIPKDAEGEQTPSAKRRKCFNHS